jgi:single-strand DNA-binding protein
MARSVNKVILLGNLGKDAELTYLPSGQAVSKFTMATNRAVKDKTSGEWQEEADWHNVVLWSEQAERLTQYLTKGQKIYLEGRIKYRTWEGKDGVKHHATDIVGERIVFVTGRGADEGAQAGARPAAAPGQARPAVAPPAAAPTPAAGQEEGLSPDITDEDIPF